MVHSFVIKELLLNIYLNEINSFHINHFLHQLVWLQPNNRIVYFLISSALKSTQILLNINLNDILLLFASTFKSNAFNLLANKYNERQIIEKWLHCHLYGCILLYSNLFIFNSLKIFLKKWRQKKQNFI